MTQHRFTPSPEFAAQANLTAAQYQDNYQHSIQQNAQYWRDQASTIDWIKPFDTVRDVSFAADDFRIKWFEEGQLNVSANCLDRHLLTHPDKPALIWEGDHPAEHKIISYRELHDEVCRFSNALKSLGAKKGDRITIYMPMIP
ncbi:MAG: acetyl-coenzyme A synthetase N-terminal domain-containing protein, partial [Flavobacteriales bacterium]